MASGGASAGVESSITENVQQIRDVLLSEGSNVARIEELLVAAARILAVSDAGSGREALLSEEVLEQFLRYSTKPCTLGSKDAAAKCVVNASIGSTRAQQALVTLGAPSMLLESLKHPISCVAAVAHVRCLLHLANSTDRGVQSAVLDLAELPHVLVATLAHTVRKSDPPFPSGAHRTALAVDVLKLMYTAAVRRDGFGDEATRTQVGLVLAHILRLPSHDSHTREVKLRASDLLLCMPPGFAHFLAATDCVRPLLDLLRGQLRRVCIEAERPAPLLVAPLAVLLRLVQESAEAKRQVKSIVFPNPVVEVGAKAGAGAGAGAGSKLDPEAKAKLLRPADAPQGSLRAHLIAQLTSLHAHVKRFASELLFTLCERDPDEYSRRVGMGNAAGFLMAQAGVPSAAR